MNSDTAKLSDDEINARRRLLLNHVIHLKSEDELEQCLSDVQALVHVPDRLLADAHDAFNEAQIERENTTASNNSNNDPQIVTMYRILRLIGDESFEEAIDAFRGIVDFDDGQLDAIITARANERRWSNNPHNTNSAAAAAATATANNATNQPATTTNQQQQEDDVSPYERILAAAQKEAEKSKSNDQQNNKTGKRGRPKGSTNKEGHNAGMPPKKIALLVGQQTIDWGDSEEDIDNKKDGDNDPSGPGGGGGGGDGGGDGGDDGGGGGGGPPGGIIMKMMNASDGMQRG